jgi:hypothetical protein
VTFFGRGERELPAIGGETGGLKRTAASGQAAGCATLKRYFPKVVLTREHDLILENGGKTEIPTGHWFSKLRI